MQGDKHIRNSLGLGILPNTLQHSASERSTMLLQPLCLSTPSIHIHIFLGIQTKRKVKILFVCVNSSPKTLLLLQGDCRDSICAGMRHLHQWIIFLSGPPPVMNISCLARDASFLAFVFCLYVFSTSFKLSNVSLLFHPSRSIKTLSQPLPSSLFLFHCAVVCNSICYDLAILLD